MTQKETEKRRRQTEIAQRVITKDLTPDELTALKQFYQTSDTKDLIHAVGREDDLFKAKPASDPVHRVAEDLRRQADGDAPERGTSLDEVANHDQRHVQTIVAENVLRQLPEKQTTDLMHYYGLKNAQELPDMMGDDDQLFSAQTPKGELIEGEAAAKQNIAQISEGHLTMGLSDGLDDLSSLDQDQAPSQA